MGFVTTLAVLILLSISTFAADEASGIRDLLNSTLKETTDTTTIPIPDGIQQLIQQAEKEQTAASPPEDNRPRFCEDSSGTFHKPAYCRSKNLPLNRCKYGGCGTYECINPTNSCAIAYAKKHGITSQGPTTTPDKIDKEDDTDSNMNDRRYFDIPGACGTNIYIENPIPGYRANSAFGYRKDPFTGRTAFHSGSDFKAPRGTAIRASAPGVMKCPAGGGYGHAIEIDHGQGVKTKYAHMSYYRTAKGKKSTSTKACQGRKVVRGEIIGYVGSTGRSTGDHLHYEIRCNGKAVNPRKYISKPTRVPLPEKRPDDLVPQGYEYEAYGDQPFDEPMDSAVDE